VPQKSVLKKSNTRRCILNSPDSISDNLCYMMFKAHFRACFCVSRNMTLRELGSLVQNESRYSLTVWFIAQKIWLSFPFKQSPSLRPLSCNIRSNGGREHASLWQIDEVPIRYGVLPMRLRKKLETFLQNTTEDTKGASRTQHIYFQQSRGLFVFSPEF
jgi:hypothetical protein